MSELRQLESDLTFIRDTVQRRRATPAPTAILWLWAVYVLIGYTWLDFSPQNGGLFLLIAGPVCGLLSWWIGKSAAVRSGEFDRSSGRCDALHWLGCFGGIAAVVLLAAIHPPLRSDLGGQMIVVVVGLAYFLYGVHRDRNFIWLGMLIWAGAIAVSFIPRYPWTALGVVFAAGLVAPTLLNSRVRSIENSSPDGGDGKGV